MNRAELKNKAKEMIRGNKWYILKPIVIVAVIIILLELIGLGLDLATGSLKKETVVTFGVTTTNFTGGLFLPIVSLISGIFSSVFAVGYAYYILSFVRGNRLEMSDIFAFIKKHWLVAFCVGLLTGLIIIGCTILLIIPGIIASFGLYYYKEVCADNPELGAMDVVKKTWAMTKGHKSEIFVLGLSFIGWAFLSAFTLGILYIWLAPYMTIAFTLFYEQIKN
jgi:uncharacterized membrane protein